MELHACIDVPKSVHFCQSINSDLNLVGFALHKSVVRVAKGMEFHEKKSSNARPGTSKTFASENYKYWGLLKLTNYTRSRGDSKAQVLQLLAVSRTKA